MEHLRAIRFGELGDVKGSWFLAVLALHLGILSQAVRDSVVRW
jgi:hypothetical protein